MTNLIRSIYVSGKLPTDPFDLTGISKSYCCSTLIKRDKVKFGVLNTVNNSNFLFLKTHKANKVSVLLLLDIAFKALLLGQSTNKIFRKDFSHAGRDICNKFKLFLQGPWAGIVSAAPTQANNNIEYCI